MGFDSRFKAGPGVLFLQHVRCRGFIACCTICIVLYFGGLRGCFGVCGLEKGFWAVCGWELCKFALETEGLLLWKY